ncbi:MAG: site-2 protease family protein [Anaerolineae bacterium]|nr:site-2 protease family protein [Anaerolineae bacterium]
MEAWPSQVSALDELSWARLLLEGVFAIEEMGLLPKGIVGAPSIQAKGYFLGDPERAYASLLPAVRARGYTLWFRRRGDKALVILERGLVRLTPNNLWLPWVLGVLTIFSMLFTYIVLYISPELNWEIIRENIDQAWLFTLSLLGILITHELGHYFTAKHFGVATSLPYLIPFPLSAFGTMGAVIRMKDIPPTRRAMLFIGAAGPLCGLAVALPVLITGLSFSSVESLPPYGGYVQEGNSILYAFLKFLIFGKWLPSGGEDVFLHPMALAGWAGLLVTAFNLIPAGQLDGGHVARSLFGERASRVTWGVILVLTLLGVVWKGWLLWAVLIFFFARRQIGPLNDVSPLRKGEKILAIALLILLILLFVPLPMKVVPPQGIL